MHIVTCHYIDLMIYINVNQLVMIQIIWNHCELKYNDIVLFQMESVTNENRESPQYDLCSTYVSRSLSPWISAICLVASVYRCGRWTLWYPISQPPSCNENLLLGYYTYYSYLPQIYSETAVTLFLGTHLGTSSQEYLRITVRRMFRHNDH